MSGRTRSTSEELKHCISEELSLTRSPLTQQRPTLIFTPFVGAPCFVNSKWCAGINVVRPVYVELSYDRSWIDRQAYIYATCKRRVEKGFAVNPIPAEFPLENGNPELPFPIQRYTVVTWIRIALYRGPYLKRWDMAGVCNKGITQFYLEPTHEPVGLPAFIHPSRTASLTARGVFRICWRGRKRGP